MSKAIQVRIDAVWLTGGPERADAEGAQGLGLAQRSKMQMLEGPLFAAQVPRDLKQRGVTASWNMTRVFDTVTAKVSYIAGLFALSPSLSYQADAFIRWPHEDEGWTEARLTWAALRIRSIVEEGPRTLRLSCQLHSAVTEDYALRARPLIVTEDGRPIVTESGRPLVGEQYQTVTVP